MEKPTELWEISGSHWTLPFSVERAAEIAIVRYVLPLLPKQQAVLASALSQLATGGHDGEWMIPMTLLLQAAQPSEQKDPEDVVVWRRVPTGTPNIAQADAEAFVTDWFATCGLFQTKATAAVAFTSLMTHVMHWLVNKREPVNLLFAKITPLPFRQNWKEILLGRRIGVKKPHPTFNPYEVITVEDVTQDDLVAFNTNSRTCDWTLELTPSKWYRTHSLEVERKRRDSSDTRYFPMIARAMQARFEIAKEIYADYLPQVRKKILDLPVFNLSDDRRFSRLKERSSGKDRIPYRAFVIPHVLTPDSVAACQQAYEERETGEVSAVPGVAPGNGAVRETRPDVDEPPNELD